MCKYCRHVLLIIHYYLYHNIYNNELFLPFPIIIIILIIAYLYNNYHREPFDELNRGDYYKNIKYGPFLNSSFRNWMSLNPSKNGFEKQINNDKIFTEDDYSKEINKCREVQESKNCGAIPPVSSNGEGCGYCVEQDKIIFGNSDGPITDVCMGTWIQPGPNTGKECEIAKERYICSNVKNCDDTKGVKNICGWCPETNTGMVKTVSATSISGDFINYVPKYPDKGDVCNWEDPEKFSTLIFGSNNCKLAKQDFPCMDGNLLTGPHSEKCFEKLWSQVGCTSDINNLETMINKYLTIKE